MADTAAERLAKAMGSAAVGWAHITQRAIDAGWVHRDDLIAQGWTPPPDPWEAIARDLCEAVWPITAAVDLFAPDTPSARMLAAVRDLIPDEAEARTIAARIEEGT